MFASLDAAAACSRFLQAFAVQRPIPRVVVSSGVDGGVPLLESVAQVTMAALPGPGLRR